MIWPWVSRDAFDVMRESRDSERENGQMLRSLLMDLSDRYRPAPAAPVVPVEPKAPIELSPVARIIREQTSDGYRTDHALASHLWRYANQLKTAGKSEDEIVGALVDWQTSEAIDVE